MRIHRWVSGSLLLGALLLSTAGAVHAQGFNAIYAKDASDVWAVGNAGQVWRSLDGGVIWGSYPLGAANHRARPKGLRPSASPVRAAGGMTVTRPLGNVPPISNPDICASRPADSVSN